MRSFDIVPDNIEPRKPRAELAPPGSPGAERIFVTTLIENVTERAKNLMKNWLIVIGVFWVSGCDVIDRTALFASTGESGTSNLTKSTVDNRIESPDAASVASQSQAQVNTGASKVPSICEATPLYNPPPIAIIRFDGQEGDFVRPLKAAIDRITTLKEEIGFELVVIIPSSDLKDRENIDVVTPRQNLDKIKNSLISQGVSELDIIYTARESRRNSVYEVHVFVLEVCPSLIEGSGSRLVTPTPSMGEVLQSARASIRA